MREKKPFTPYTANQIKKYLNSPLTHIPSDKWGCNQLHPLYLFLSWIVWWFFLNFDYHAESYIFKKINKRFGFDKVKIYINCWVINCELPNTRTLHVLIFNKKKNTYIHKNIGKPLKHVFHGDCINGVAVGPISMLYR